MAINISLALRNALLQGSSVKEELDNGFIYFYAGPVPANADAALDMTVSTGLHTQLAKIAADATPVDAGTVGLLFDAATNGALPKAAAQTWAAKVHFVGKDEGQAGVSALTATFYRFCKAADNGQAAGTASTTPRIQGSIAVSGGDINLTSVSLSDNGTNETGLASYEVRMPGA